MGVACVQLQSMWAWLIPVLKSALVNFTIESLTDWGTCFATASVRFLHSDSKSLLLYVAV